MGFFTEGQVAKEAVYIPKAEDLKGECGKCGHWENSKHPNVEYSGQGHRKILVVSDYPTLTDDVYGTYLRGEVGSILHNELRKYDISLQKDCWCTCAHRCIPKESVKDNLSKYIKFCQPYLHSIVMKLQPEYILLMGRWAITGFYHPHYSGSEGSYSPHRWRGIPIRDPKWNAIIFSTFHPKEQIIQPNDKSHVVLFQRDIETFCNLVENNAHKNIKKVDYEQYTSVLTSYPDVIGLFNRIIDNKIAITFDYETTGLKPFSKGHKAVLVGIAVSPTEAYAVPLQYKNMWTQEEYTEIERLWKIILGSPDIKKNNHNILFEDVWSYGIFGIRLRGVDWDTQLGAHVMDNRRMYTGLKFQTYIHFGVLSYDEHIHKYLVSERKVSEYNTVEKAPFRDLAIYCALDCIFSYRLMLIQKKFFTRPENWKQYNAFKFYKKGIGVMSELQINGIRSDVDYFTRSNEEVIRKVTQLEQELLSGEEAQLFLKHTGRPMKLTATDIGILLYDILHYSGEISKKGNYITDKNALSMIQSQFTDKYNELQKYRKIHNSFFTNYIYYTSDDNRIHGSFTINHVVSYRSAATDPNMQNTSKRDKEAKTLLRTGFLPDPNSILIEADFSGAEVNVSASTHGDKNFIKYLLDPSTNMHADEMLNIFMLPHEEYYNPDFTHEQHALAKKIRNTIKGKWVFAQFYGDWYKSCGDNIWKDIQKEQYILPSGKPLLTHLEEKGITTREEFIEHCERCEHALWYERFPEYTQWKNDIYNFYLRHGYIENFFGFRFQGYMDKKTATNYPIQSVSFQLLVNVLISVSKYLKKERMRSKLIAQIHDSCVASVRLDEVDKYIKFFNETVCTLHERHKWMKVPMKAEFEISKPAEQGGNFAKMFEVPEGMLSNHIDLTQIYEG